MSNACDAVGDGNARQTGAIIESKITNAYDAVGNGDARQTGATTESLIPNAGDTIGDGDARQTGAIIESIISNAGDAVCHGIVIHGCRNDNIAGIFTTRHRSHLCREVISLEVVVQIADLDTFGKHDSCASNERKEKGGDFFHNFKEFELFY